MVITVETILTCAGVLSAIGVIFGVIVAIVKWFNKQEKQSTDIQEMKQQHEQDMKTIEEHHDEDLKAVQKELCVLNYALLASLDALIKQGYDGAVVDAHDKILKHLNEKAHGKDGN